MAISLVTNCFNGAKIKVIGVGGAGGELGGGPGPVARIVELAETGDAAGADRAVGGPGLREVLRSLHALRLVLDVAAVLDDGVLGAQRGPADRVGGVAVRLRGPGEQHR